MRIRQAFAAAVGAALLSVGTSATVALAVGDNNSTGKASNTPTATGGTVAPSQNPHFGDVTVTASGSPCHVLSSQASKAKSGNSDASSKGSARSGAVGIHF